MQCIFALHKLQSTLLQSTKSQNRPLFYWLTLIFNRVDNDQIKLLGPDRACAQWLMRNGATLRWKGFSQYVEHYDHLPTEKNNYRIESVYATDAGIHYVGFPYFKGCEYIEEIKLINCKYIEDNAMNMLAYVKDSLKQLEIIDCKCVTDKGLLKLKALQNLEQLTVSKPPYTDNINSVQKELKEALPNCNITIQ